MMGSVLLRVAFQLVAILESPHLSLSLSFVIVFFCLPNRSFLLFVVSFSSRFAIDSPIVWR